MQTTTHEFVRQKIHHKTLDSKMSVSGSGNTSGFLRDESKDVTGIIRMASYGPSSDIDAASLCSSPSSVKVRLRHTFLDFKDGNDNSLLDICQSPRADSEFDQPLTASSPLRRSQSDCTGVDRYIRERLGSNAGLVDDVVEIDCDAPFSPSGHTSPISSLVHKAANAVTGVSILSFSPPTFQHSALGENGHPGANTGSSDFVMVMEEDPPLTRIRPPSIFPGNPLSALPTQPNTPQQYTPVEEVAEKTTVMLRNIPNKYTQRMLLDQLNRSGFEGKYDFFYLPIDFRNRCNVGYAFINFHTNATASEFKQMFDGLRLTGFNSQKICEVSYARVQGLKSNIQHYRNSPVNGISVPEYRPLLFANGQEIPFPFLNRPELHTY